jgi:peptidoglycan hydrolase-like amidase
MDNASKQILTIQTIDKRMTGRKSAAMEKLGFQAAMNELKSKEVTVKEVVTDAHLGIGALMSKYNAQRLIKIFFYSISFIIVVLLPDIFPDIFLLKTCR